MYIGQKMAILMEIPIHTRLFQYWAQNLKNSVHEPFFKEPLEFCKMNDSIKVSYHWPKKKLYTCTYLAGPTEPRGQKGIPPSQILVEFESKPVPSKDSITIYNQKTLYHWLPTQIFRPTVGSASSWRDFFPIRYIG